MIGVFKSLQRLWSRLFPTRKQPVKRQKRGRTTGAHYYLRDLLSNLDEYFSDQRLIRRASGDIGDMITCAGVGIYSDEIEVPTSIDPSFYALGFPGFWGGYLNKDASASLKEKTGIVSPRLIAIQLVRRPWNVQPSNSPTYHCAMVYIDNGRSVMAEFYASICKDGIRALKVAKPRPQTLPNRSRFYRLTWQYPACLSEFESSTTDDPHKAASEILSVCLNLAWQQESGLMVRCSKAGRSAVFAIDMLRTPYFFSQREKVLTDSGRAKPIFHIVRPHKRDTIHGERWIRSHWRGVRKFRWNGYNVNITLAGKHHKSITHSNIEAIDASATDRPVGTITSVEFSERIAAAMENA